MIQLPGRSAEVAAAVEVATGAGTASAILIEGPAGIGKTVVLDAAVHAATQAGALVLVARPSEADAANAFLGLHDLLEPALPELMPSLAAPQRARIERALGLRPADDEDPLETGQLAIAIVAGLRALALRRRLVLAVDDLQWLDSSTASVLEVALARLGAADVRLLAAARDDGATAGRSAAEHPRIERLPIERLFRDRILRVRLDGLSVGVLHRLLTDRLGRPVPRPTLIRVHAITEGNPLHALELARSLDAGGDVDGALDSALPTDIAALLRRRVERLPTATRELLAVVALSPRPSSETIELTLGIPAGEVEARAAAALDDGLLLASPRGFALRHPLVGSAVRATLGPAGRRALHRRLAEVVRDPDQAAVHLSLSASGPDESIASALEAAARRGLARGATVDAIDDLARTVELTPPDRHDDAVRRRLLLARALLLAGDTARAGRELAALDVDTIPDPTARAEAVLLFGVVQRYLGEYDAAIRRHAEALRWPLDDATRGRLHARLAWLRERDLGVALEDAEKALVLLESSTAPLDYSFVVLIRARLRLELGIAADHEDVARGSLLQAAGAERDWNVSTTPIDWAIWMDDWPRARALLDAGLRLAEDAGDETLAGHLLRRRTEVETWSGELATAAALADAAVERAESTQQRPAIASAVARRALIRAHTGPVALAAQEAERALSLAGQIDTPVVFGYAATAVAAAATAAGDLRRVIDVASQAMATLDATGHVDQAAHRFHADLLEALVGVRDMDAARALADRLERRGALGPRPTWSAIAERGRAGIALAEGDLDEAARRIELALQHLALPPSATSEAAAGRVPIETARTLIVAGEVERRHGRRRAAAARFEQAVAILDRVGAAPLASVARDHLRRVAVERVDIGVLTPAEERIAILAADGLRNREIASRLAISVKTVEAALARTYDKLAIGSRAQLGAALQRRVEGGQTRGS